MNGKRKEDTTNQEQFLQEFTKLNTRTQYLIYTICLADPNSTKKEIILGWIADFDDLKQEGIIENYSKLKNEQVSGVFREFNRLNRFNQFLSNHNILYSNENFDSKQTFEEFTNSIFYHRFKTMIAEKHYEDEDTFMINPAFFG